MDSHLEDVLLAERAAEWLLQLPSADFQQRKHFVQWLKESPENVREMLLAMSFDELLRSVRPGRGRLMS